MLKINLDSFLKKEKLVLYRGPIKKIFISNLDVNDNKLIPTFKSEKNIENSLFYPSAEGMINLDYKCVLPNEKEAEKYVRKLINNRTQVLIGQLLSPNISLERKEKIKDYLKRISTCIYYDKNDLVISHSISPKQFQKIKVHNTNNNPFSKTHMF